jgi:hypothetical protein
MGEKDEGRREGRGRGGTGEGEEGKEFEQSIKSTNSY